MLNRDAKRRNNLLDSFFVKNSDDRIFCELTAEVMQQLIDENFLDPEDTQNDSPSAGEFLDFMKKYPFVKAHGYAVDVSRSDYRITIEGIEAEIPSDENVKITFIIDFADLCRDASEFDIGEKYAYAWWD